MKSELMKLIYNLEDIMLEILDFQENELWIKEYKIKGLDTKLLEGKKKNQITDIRKHLIQYREELQKWVNKYRLVEGFSTTMESELEETSHFRDLYESSRKVMFELIDTTKDMEEAKNLFEILSLSKTQVNNLLSTVCNVIISNEKFVDRFISLRIDWKEKYELYPIVDVKVPTVIPLEIDLK